MEIKEIFEAFDKIGSITMTTMDGEYPSSRIVQILTYDDNGLYFFTMSSKPFYKQLIETGKIALCGLSAPSEVEWVDEDTPYSAPGYFIRLTGDVREFTLQDAIDSKDPRFNYIIEDNKRYPLVTGFCIYNFRGEIYDYDFEKEKRDYKLDRVRFAFGEMEKEPVGLTILKEKCVACGKCVKTCSFTAIYKDGDKYAINGNKCDECGNCFNTCPAKAVLHKGA